MAVTETTTESWGSRLGNSIKGVIVGLGLFVLGFPVLFWNEGNSVKTAKSWRPSRSSPASQCCPRLRTVPGLCWTSMATGRSVPDICRRSPKTLQRP